MTLLSHWVHQFMPAFWTPVMWNNRCPFHVIQVKLGILLLSTDGWEVLWDALLEVELFVQRAVCSWTVNCFTGVEVSGWEILRGNSWFTAFVNFCSKHTYRSCLQPINNKCWRRCRERGILRYCWPSLVGSCCYGFALAMLFVGSTLPSGICPASLLTSCRTLLKCHFSVKPALATCLKWPYSQLSQSSCPAWFFFFSISFIFFK